MDDIEAMFNQLVRDMDGLSQNLMARGEELNQGPRSQTSLSASFTDLNAESLNELEDQDLDALVADLGAESIKSSNADKPSTAAAQECQAAASLCPSNTAKSSGKGPMSEAQIKAAKIRLALRKLAEAKVRKLVIKVLMTDGSYMALMVDERQVVGEVLDRLFEKTHCDRSIDWSLIETNSDLQTERIFEDHECLVELLSMWGRHSNNRIYFLSAPQKYEMFRNPQLFYMWEKEKSCLCGFNQQAKQLLVKEHFEGPAVIVPDLEGILYLKQEDKKVWRPRYFLLRASGLYYVPKGKTKCSANLTCFVRFDKLDVYNAKNYKQKYRAPTDFCFILKHPCIQKESNYIKFLCCDDEDTLMLWTTSIRIAKYEAVLYKSYQAAVKRASPPQTAQTETHGERASCDLEDFPDEPPPDFIPPPPPRSAAV
ncbi:amyloid beta A4 precursor protein-binding family B member 1-interacting protein-like [Takifugu flavidus]|uniref:Amyloid beta A4 precursor protein-binding family B member 1-interacting protein n=1 Tax=Takifugu flavidus TaxID=433684 RepID=A0A5C6P0S9_9TELE|nr:amyloid beta A4 precursor protein-binding family B member 1-interacting protein-like [Takifugu flavidus]TWW72905.1 APBB1-interacting protein 1 [Takifugu flavidus]